MPNLPAFISSAYESRSVNVAADRLVNLYPEVVETTKGKHVAAYYGTPGLRRTHTLPGSGGIRGMYTSAAARRVFAVRGDAFYEIFSGGTHQLRGMLSTNSGPVSMADNGKQLMVVDGAQGYILTLSTNLFQVITDPDFPPSPRVVFLDGFFVFFFPGTGRFGITGLLDGFSVDPLDFATAEGSPDNIISILADHRELWIAGTRSIEVWFNSGNVDFPFSRIQGAFIEYGCGAPESLVNLDNTVYWLGSDERGQHMVWRADGYQPARVSTHAIETAIASYSSSSRANARAYAYWQEGHANYVLNFDEATWVYDVASKLWHERSYLSNDGVMTRHRGNNHTVGLGFNLVGDAEDGRIYALDLNHYTDDGDEIVRMRRCPHFAGDELQRLFHHWLQLDLESGVGLDGSPTVGADPRLLLRFSDDGGHTWSNDKESRIGKRGEHKFRAFWNRLGYSRDRVYEIRQTDPVKTAWINAKIQASVGRH